MYDSSRLPSQPTNNTRVGGISTLFGQGTRGIVGEIPPDDEYIDGEGRGQGFKVRDCLRRGIWVLSFGNQQEIDTFQLNPVTKAVFGLASVTFEVCVRHWRIRRRGDA